MGVPDMPRLRLEIRGECRPGHVLTFLVMAPELSTPICIYSLRPGNYPFPRKEVTRDVDWLESAVSTRIDGKQEGFDFA